MIPTFGTLLNWNHKSQLLPMNAIVKKIKQQKIAENTAVIMLLNGKNDNDRECYTYFAVRLDMFADFKKAIAEDRGISLDDYGVVIASGLGTPDEETKLRMKEEYQFDY